MSNKDVILVPEDTASLIMVPVKAVTADLKTDAGVIVYVPLATTKNPGIVQIGKGLKITDKGLLSVDVSDISAGIVIKYNNELVNENATTVNFTNTFNVSVDPETHDVKIDGSNILNRIIDNYDDDYVFILNSFNDYYDKTYIDNMIVDDLETDSAVKALSAKQGVILKDLVLQVPHARVFDNISLMVSVLNGSGLDAFNIGTTFRIIDLDVPDFWVSGVYDDYQSYEYTTDEDLVNVINSDKKLRIGYYDISKAETEKVVFDDINHDIGELQADISDLQEQIDDIDLSAYVDRQSVQEISGVKTFVEQIGIKNTDGTTDYIKHINNNLLISTSTGTNLLNIDEGLSRIYAFNKELAFKSDITGASGSKIYVGDSTEPEDSISFDSDPQTQLNILYERASMPIGSIISSAIPLTDAGVHLLDGSTISQNGIYSEFVSLLKNLIAQGYSLACTQDEFDSDISRTGSCGKFVIDDVAGTVRLPRITKFIQGVNSLNDLGITLNEQLPNIRGSLGSGGVYGFDAFVDFGTDPNNSFKGTHSGGWRVSTINEATEGKYDFVEFNANNNNPIYVDGAHVQPYSTQYPYYIVLANVYKTDVQIDIDAISAEINDKFSSYGGHITGNVFMNYNTLYDANINGYLCSPLATRPTSLNFSYDANEALKHHGMLRVDVASGAITDNSKPIINLLPSQTSRGDGQTITTIWDSAYNSMKQLFLPRTHLPLQYRQMEDGVWDSWKVIDTIQSANFTNSGYVDYSSGLQVRWGHFTLPSTTAARPVYFGAAFSHAIVSIVATPVPTSGNGAYANLNIYSINNSSFDARLGGTTSTDSSGMRVCYVAFGY